MPTLLDRIFRPSPVELTKDLRFVALPDAHIPYHDKDAMSCAMKILKWYKPHITVILGDWLDGAPVSHHMLKQLQLREGLRLKDDFDALNTQLDCVQEYTDKLVYLQGNHELWVDKFIEENPELDGLVNIEPSLQFDKRGVLYLPYNVPYTIGKLCFTHGLFTTKHHARAHVEAFGRSVVYGHTHTVQSYVQTSPIDVSDRHIGLSLGCLADRNPHYMRNKPNAWVHACAVGMVRSDGNFNIDPIIINDGVASYASKTFVG